MKSKIVIIIPYFGKFPNYFPVFLYSCKHIKMVDFLIFTDDETINGMYIPETASVNILSWSRMTQMIADRNLGKPTHAYKLCDYRPCYGVIFQEYIKEYEYWGYCDIDTLMGDIDSFLMAVDYEKYDRIGRYGHFTLYRNTPSVNNIFRIKIDIEGFPSFSNIKNTCLPCSFDEVWANLICKSIGLTFLENFPCVNINFDRNLHFHTYSRCHLPELFVWDHGKLFAYYKDKEDIKKEEKAYIHYMLRKDMPTHGELGEQFLITHEGFFHFEESKIDTYFRTYGRPDTSEELISFQKDFKNYMWMNRKRKFIRELKYCGLFLFENLWTSYKMNKLLKKMNFN